MNTNLNLSTAEQQFSTYIMINGIAIISNNFGNILFNAISSTPTVFVVFRDRSGTVLYTHLISVN